MTRFRTLAILGLFVMITAQALPNLERSVGNESPTPGLEEIQLPRAAAETAAPASAAPISSFEAEPNILYAGDGPVLDERIYG